MRTIWSFGIVVLLLCIGALLILNWYIHDRSDLVAVDARAAQLGIAGSTEQVALAPQQSVKAMTQLGGQIRSLTGFDAAESSLGSVTTYFGQPFVLPHDRGSATWNQAICARIEASIDAFGDQPLILVHGDRYDGADRRAIIDFLGVRILAANRAQLPDRERRLARFLLTMDPCGEHHHAIPALRLLNVRLSEMPQSDPAIAELVRRFADRLPSDMRFYAAVQFTVAREKLSVPGVRTVDWFGDMRNCEDNPLVASWDVRRWRSLLLSDWIDLHEDLKDLASCIQAAKMPWSPPRELLVIECRARSPWSIVHSESLRFCQTMMLARLVESKLLHTARAVDVFDPAGLPLRCKESNGGLVTYSVGADGIDGGGDWGFQKDLFLCIEPAFPAPVPQQVSHGP